MLYRPNGMLLNVDGLLALLIGDLHPLPVGFLDRWRGQQRQDQVDELATAIAGKLEPAGSRGLVATSQERHWLSAHAVVALKEFFHKASQEIGVRLRIDDRGDVYGCWLGGGARLDLVSDQ